MGHNVSALKIRGWWGLGGGGECERERERKRERATKPTYNKVSLLNFCRKDAHFPVRDLNVLSAYPVIVNPTHYVGDKGWFSDTKPSPEILAQIREREKREEAEEQKKLMEKKQGRHRGLKGDTAHSHS